MATIAASKWGVVTYEGDTSWNDTHGASTGTNVYNNTTSSDYASVYIDYETGSKGSTWVLRRFFIAFDASSYASGYAISNLKLYYYPTTSTTNNFKIAIVKSTAQGNANSNLTTADYNSFDDSVTYATNDGTDIWADSTSLSYFDLNATAISAFTNSYVKLCILEYTHDYLDNAPSFATYWHGNGNFNGMASGGIPYLSFTATATGYENDVIGVSSSNIDSVNAIARADIDQIIGV